MTDRHVTYRAPATGKRTYWVKRDGQWYRADAQWLVKPNAKPMPPCNLRDALERML